MSNRQYRLIYGAALLFALYMELLPLVYILIALSIFEVITDLRLPKIISQYRYGHPGDLQEGTIGINFTCRTNVEAERIWRLFVVSLLAISILIFPDTLWFIPWFLGFAILGAGVSGVCPVYLVMKWLGLK